MEDLLDDLIPIAALIDYVWKDMKRTQSDVFEFSPAFFNDVANNALPAFSLIEPIYQMYGQYGDVAPNSNHPGSSVATNSDESRPFG